MISLTDAQIIALVDSWLWPFLRVSALVMAAPIIGTRTVPMQIRASLALLITAVLVPVVPRTGVIDAFSPEGIATCVAQVLTGVGIGLALRLIFMVMEVAGQIIAQQMGLGFAALIDPQSGAQVPVISQFYIIMATLLFLSVNGHLLMIEVLANSFDLIPISVESIGRGGLMAVVDWAGSLLAIAVQMSLPVIVALLVVNVALGVMGRAAPQLNIIAVGFPIMIVFGVAVAIVSLASLDEYFTALMETAFMTVNLMLAG
ncbi:MAG: flagellar biosynthetic protein FliR [Gammaproteobacteria bacterium]|nr:flagellar biosynthetic protein FliR [Gammaproteobacteria bacterium]